MTEYEDPGVRFGRDGALVERALGLLAEGPASSVVLAKRVLAIDGAAPAVAERLVEELLSGEPRVSRDAAGEWRVPAGSSAGGSSNERPLDRLRYAVVDVETTGIVGSGGRIIELAVVHVDRGAITDSFSTLVDAGVSIPPWITRLTGIRTEMIRGAPRFAEIDEEVRHRLSGRVFVAHSAGYDWAFLREEMRRVGGVVPRGPQLCTVHFARRLLPGLERRGLGELARYYGVEIRGRHRARGDAIATAQVLVRMIADAERRGWTTWEALQRGLGPLPRPRKRRALDGSGSAAVEEAAERARNERSER
ncbi:MAG: 3'-5' exonuclease [Gemmatimonadetes bacterium]|nr:3'-5' exonuclease [Gemmatimonadota bacterium]